MPEKRPPDAVTLGLIQSIAFICQALRARPRHSEEVRRALAELRLDEAFKEVLVDENRQVSPPPSLPPSPPSDSPPIRPPVPPPCVTIGGKTGARIRSADVKEMTLFKTPESLPPTVEEIVQLWNETFSLPRVNTLGRRTSIVQKALKDPFFAENWRAGIKKIAKTKFCLGHNARRWKATILWFCEPSNLDNLMAGHYDHLSSSTEPPKEKDYERTEI